MNHEEDLPLKEVVLSVGSNHGDRAREVESGIEWLKGVLTDCVSSTIYPSPDCLGGQKEYMNAVVRGKTRISPERLETMCKEYETAHGRTPEIREKGYVPIDIDIVILDGVIIRERDVRQRFFQVGYSMI